MSIRLAAEELVRIPSIAASARPSWIAPTPEWRAKRRPCAFFGSIVVAKELRAPCLAWSRAQRKPRRKALSVVRRVAEAALLAPLAHMITSCRLERAGDSRQRLK